MAMRKRLGKNWFAVIDGASLDRAGSKAVQEQLESLTLLNENSEDDWLNSMLRLTPDCSITQSHALTNEGWTLTSIQIDRRNSLFQPLTVDPDVMRAVELFDGTKTVREVATVVHNLIGASYKEAEARTVALAKRLVRSAYVVPVHA